MADQTKPLAEKHQLEIPKELHSTLTPVVETVSNITEAAKGSEFKRLQAEAQCIEEADQHTTLWKSLKAYPKAAAWSILLSTSIIMEGYDGSLISSFFAFPQFTQKYGEQLPSGEFELSMVWQNLLLNSSILGTLLGLALNGYLCDHVGYKKTFAFFMTIMTVAVFPQFFAPDVRILTFSQWLCGIPWGAFRVLATAYASEVCPAALRGYLTTFTNVAWLIGQTLASGVLRGLLDVPGEWSYRLAFAFQWIFPVPLLVAVIFAPESPRYLCRKARIDDAKKAQRRLMGKHEREGAVQARISEIRLTNAQEKEISAGTTYWDCFKGVNLRRTEITCLTWASQNLCGSALMGYSTLFYFQAGLSTTQAFNFTMIQYIIGFFGTFLAWALMARFGRRTLYLSGLALGLVVLCAIGGLGFATSPTVSWVIGSLLLLYTFVYDSTCGPVCYALISEISSTRLRQKTMVLGSMTYNLATIFNYSMMPLFINTTAFDWGAKTALFWAGVCFLCLVWCFFRLPETKSGDVVRPYSELNWLFEQRVNARDFASTEVPSLRSRSIISSKQIMMAESA